MVERLVTTFFNYSTFPALGSRVFLGQGKPPWWRVIAF